MNTNICEIGALTSRWDGLSDKLIASFYEVEKATDGEYWKRISSSPVVKAPLTEANMEIALNWQSPFEQAGPESKAPALLAMLQSGALQPMIDAALGKAKDGADASAAQKKAGAFVKQFEGRTGITKLNSTQVFNGMPPVKIQVTALFRAWIDPVDEVESPFEQLMQWALPVELSPDGSVLARMAQSAKGEMGFIQALVPSLSPVKIAMHYKNRTFSPLVIESIGQPLNSPVDKNGNFVELVVPMTLCTLTAIDRLDWSFSKRSEL